MDKKLCFIVLIELMFFTALAQNETTSESKNKVKLYLNSGIVFNNYDFEPDKVKQNNSVTANMGIGAIIPLQKKINFKIGLEYLNSKTLDNNDRIMEYYIQTPILLNYSCRNLNTKDNAKNIIKLNISLGGFNSILMSQGVASSGDNTYNFNNNNSYGKIGYMVESYLSMQQIQSKHSYIVGLRNFADITHLSYEVQGVNNRYYDKYNSLAVFLGVCY